MKKIKQQRNIMASMKSRLVFRFSLCIATIGCAIVVLGGSINGFNCLYQSKRDCRRFIDTCLSMTSVEGCTQYECWVYTAPIGQYCMLCNTTAGCVCVYDWVINVVGYSGDPGQYGSGQYGCTWGTACNSGECFCLYNESQPKTLQLYVCSIP